jgi:hypothetical protein
VPEPQRMIRIGSSGASSVSSSVNGLSSSTALPNLELNAIYSS